MLASTFRGSYALARNAKMMTATANRMAQHNMLFRSQATRIFSTTPNY